ncbi:hypothetical protein AVEN_165511-1 [Araneus ventricosus]|uniref:RNase H type-1 domain-containing protein n=1 Tax=Araneus ventricosus TaxID=182803 RepID=A0A4Y2JZF9_ARAVE|nr:hypothetical protein AVEN_165511-1 [Araneus ventricosus]
MVYQALSQKYRLPGRNPSTAQNSGTRRCLTNSATDYSCRQLSQNQSATNPMSRNSIVRKIFKFLHSHPHIRVSWIKAHAGYIGNEEADRLAVVLRVLFLWVNRHTNPLYYGLPPHNLLPYGTTQPTTSASMVPQRSQQFSVKKEDT